MPATFTEEGLKAETNPVSSPRPDLHSFLNELLAEQQQLQTPVARFADRHSSLVARHSSLHSELIPLTAPGPGEHYAFEVDLDACSGCKACVAGCHSLNGLDDHETWRDVGLVLGGDATNPFQQTITSACHHCADPACANGCPVLAYEKDPVTGIVRHLDDQCIGCSYCILKCPYDVPKFNSRLGIVRKCDMCQGRLAAGEAPACVQACPTHAITITKVRTIPAVGAAAAPATFLPVFPGPDYTQPTTRYLSRRQFPVNLRAADATALRLQPAHWPLALMLVLTQASVGFSIVRALAMPEIGARLGGLALATGMIGVAASVAHLGQPLRAWRVFLGLRKSWLSREAVLLGGYVGLLAATFVPWLPQNLLEPAVIGTGLLAVFCSIMIYVDTRRAFWQFPASSLRMGGTVAIAALAFFAPLLAAATLALKLGGEGLALRGTGSPARLQRGPLRRVVLARFALGGTALALFVVPLPAIALGLWFLGELAERHIYFRAVDAPKMPGVSVA